MEFESIEEALAYYEEFSGLVLTHDIELYASYAESMSLADWELPTLQLFVREVNTSFDNPIPLPDKDYDLEDSNRSDHTVIVNEIEVPFEDTGFFVQYG